MPYALVDPKDGQRPAYRLAGGPDDLSPGEVPVEREPKAGEVWDGAAGALRIRTEAERLAGLKADKRAELVLAADAEYRAIFTRDGQYVELEKDHLMLRSLMGLALSQGQLSQRAAMRTVVEKLQTRLQAVSAAATAAEVGAVAWS